MPEGHTIRRALNDQAPGLVGRALSVSSPNRRFESGAAALDGLNLKAMDAWGKNLFYVFPGRKVLHVHLGMDGRFRRHAGPPDAAPAAGRSVWLRLGAPELTVDLHTPKVCRLVDEIRRRRELAGLGPDPLRDDADPERAGQNVLAHPGTIGEALLDQSRVAGIGNVYRAEVLFACGIHPLTPAAGLSSDDWDRIWACAVEQLHAGVHNRGDIVTVDPTDRAARDGRKTWVYRQRLCARCGSAVRTWDLGGRVAFACETCQPPPVPS